MSSGVSVGVIAAALSVCLDQRHVGGVIAAALSVRCVRWHVRLDIAAVFMCRAGRFVYRDVAGMSECCGEIDEHLGLAVVAPSIGYLLLAVRL